MRGAIRGWGQIRWRSTLSSSLGSRHTKEIAWGEFCEVFYNQYFSVTMIEEKKIEFMAFGQKERAVVEYHERFLASERFAPSTFLNERQRVVKFMRRL